MPPRYDSPAAELMADAETCAIEILAAAVDLFALVHNDVVAQIHGLPETMDCLPKPVAAMLAELKHRAEWSVAEMGPVIMRNVSAVKHSRSSYNVLRCIRVISEAEAQNRAINAAHDLLDAVYAMNRPETEKRLQALVDVLKISLEKRNAPDAVESENRARKENLQCKA